MFKFKAGENFNHPDEIGTSIHTLSILRIVLKLHFVQNVELNAEIGQKGVFCKGLKVNKSGKCEHGDIYDNIIFN